VCAQDLRLLARLARLEVEGVLHCARRVEFRHVERSEVVPLILDFRTFGDREAEVREDLGKLVHHLAHRVDASARRVGGGEREVDALGCQLTV